MKRVLLLTDFSEPAENAIEFSRCFYKNEKVDFYLVNIKDSRGLYVNDIMSGNLAEDVHNSIINEAQGKIDLALNELKTNSQINEHRFFAKVLFGSFFKVLNRFINDQEIDVLVMGATGAGGAKEILFGSTASRVMSKIRLPMLIVPKKVQFNTISKVLFSVDYKVDFLSITLLPLFDLLQNNNCQMSIVYANEEGEELTLQQQLNKKELLRILGDYNCSNHIVNNLKLNDVVSVITDFMEADIIVMIKKGDFIMDNIFKTSNLRKMSYYIKTPLFIMPEKQISLD